MDKGYPRDLFNASETVLQQLKLRRDEFDRLRDQDGSYVCEITGHAHDHYLRPWVRPMPEHGADVVWVCDHGVEELATSAAAKVVQRATAIIGERAAKSGARGFFKNLGEFIMRQVTSRIFGA